MTEIRPIRADESDAFLQLLCDVFNITFERVRGVFYGEPFYDLNRKWALFEDGEMLSILSTTPLQFGWGSASGIAGVATLPDARGRGYATELISATLRAHQSQGEIAMFLFAEDPRVYKNLGFEILDEVVKTPLESDVGGQTEILTSDEVQLRYDRWSMAHPNRLRRDERRWRYWKWNFRLCAEVGPGYVCQEGQNVREAVDIEPGQLWPTTEACHWLGLRSMIDVTGAKVGPGEKTTHLMGHGTSEVPQIFLTDQW